MSTDGCVRLVAWRCFTDLTGFAECAACRMAWLLSGLTSRCLRLGAVLVSFGGS